MDPRRMFWFALAVIAAGWYASRKVWLPPRSATRASAVDAAVEPAQEPLDEAFAVTVERGGKRYRLEGLARWDVSGHVVSASAYDLAWTSDFYDVDLGLAWGPRVAEMLERYTFHQDHRWLFWRSAGPVSEAERVDITRHIGNQHLIPRDGSTNLARAIRWVGAGDQVRIRGVLVRILDEAGVELVRSSTSRGDSGGGACEVVWVDELQVGDKVYR